jgi:hypothetical protein
MSEADASDGLEEVADESSSNDNPLKYTFPASPHQDPSPNISIFQYELSPSLELNPVIDLSPGNTLTDTLDKLAITKIALISHLLTKTVYLVISVKSMDRQRILAQ